MKIPFDIKFRPQIESGEYKVETRDGRPVKIISFEMTDTNDCPIAAQFRLCAGTPVVYLFDKEGHYKGEGDSDYSLFIVTPEEELTEFEQQIENLLNLALPEGHAGTTIENTKRVAAELLSLATEEIKKKFVFLDYQAAFDAGKAEALKDLPRWKKWGNGACGNGIGIPLAIVKRGLDNYQVVDVLGIQGEKYLLISDLEKLPGFKEEDSHE